MSTYTPIASVTLSSAQSSVTFSGIPQTYTDLVLVVNMKVASQTGSDSIMRFNGDSGNNYSFRWMYGNGTTTSSGSSSNNNGARIDYFVTPGTTDGFVSISNLQNYSNTTTYKTVLTRDSSNASNTSYPGTEALVSLWRSTSAITSITLVPSGDSYAAGSTFNLYGVANASITNVAKATGGDSVYTDGTYWYHIFRSSGTFTPTQALTADYLVVAGGGAGAKGKDNTGSGGGGAGGYRTSIGGSAVSFSNNVAYTVTVGAGGAAGTTANQQGPAGSNSSISGTGITTVTSTGGAGGVSQGSARASGGSGGGGESFTASGVGTAGNSGSYSPVEGYAGGNAYTTAGGRYPGGGGGGSSAVGGNATSNTGGAGGAGTANSISGSSVTYAGGGGGGTGYNTGLGGAGGAGGSGGGGAGSNSATAGTSGTANLGGGGGGGSGEGTYQSNGGAGGSGIVIVRYGV